MDSSDGKRTRNPWLGVFGAALFLISTHGFAQSIGVVQSYLELNQLQDYQTSDIGWIIGLYSLLSLVLGIIAGPLIDYFGIRPLTAPALVLSTLLYFVMAECTNYWHFMLCLGVLGGVGGAVASTLAISAAGKLFVERRGTAIGFALAGASVGGVAIPLLLNATFPRFGWAWSMRILGFIILVLNLIGSLCLVLVSDQVPLNTDLGIRSAAPSLEAFGSGTFCFTTVGFALIELAMFGINGLLPTFAVSVGFSLQTAYVLLSVLAGSSFFGRIVAGVAADYIGSFNALVIMNTFSAVVTAALYVPFGDRSPKALFAFASLWGFGSGSCLSLVPACVGKTCDRKDYGRYLGTMLSVTSISALIAIPAGGEMLDRFGPRATAGFFLATAVGSSISFTFARWRLGGKFLNFTQAI
ncbi:unnamed protein product [Clonostachys byssicola]|uniref:Major facilitator superfamily (MFS) profile domain-containing protein n=1 Tax=Clonostachys byssicola TaxID=160290 RepID=A0A9N9UX31_9HYPO|nr:unnamed protein product [Clonostachys byssicola]